MFQEIKPSHKNNNLKVTPKIQTLIYIFFKTSTNPNPKNVNKKTFKSKTLKTNN
jgi:hypothetical protein